MATYTYKGTAITGTETSPATTLPSAPSIPATAITALTLRSFSSFANRRCRPATPTSYNRSTRAPKNSAVRAASSATGRSLVPAQQTRSQRQQACRFMILKIRQPFLQVFELFRRGTGTENTLSELGKPFKDHCDLFRRFSLTEYRFRTAPAAYPVQVQLCETEICTFLVIVHCKSAFFVA